MRLKKRRKEGGRKADEGRGRSKERRERKQRTNIEEGKGRK